MSGIFDKIKKEKTECNEILDSAVEDIYSVF